MRNTALKILPVQWWPAACVAVVSAVFLVYRWALGHPLWLDEEMLALTIRERGVADLVGRLWFSQSAPFGWIVAERIAVMLFGTGELALRLQPVLFGVGTLAVAFWLGHRWLGPVATTVLLLLCGFGTWVSFYALELKPYSSDVFWALLLPALAMWVTESRDEPTLTRRLLTWWILAAIGQWLGNGALFVTPACAGVIAAVLFARGGWRTARAIVWPSLIWLIAFGAHYQTTLNYTANSRYMRDYWAFALPPANADIGTTVGWIAKQIEPIATKPGGSEYWIAFWIVAGVGLVLLSRSRPTLGLGFALVPVTGFVLGGLGLVPLFERLALWIVPALYVGVSATIGTAVNMGRRFRPWPMMAIAAGVVGVIVSYDIAMRGALDHYRYRFNADAGNHQLDDRAGVDWLMSQRTRGDVVLSTYLALPAVWWYGKASVANPERGREVQGLPFLQVFYRDQPGCSSDRVASVLRGHRRALVYFGFRFDDVPPGFDQLLIDQLVRMGSVTGYQRFSGAGASVIVDFEEPPMAEGYLLPPLSGIETASERPPGCLGVRSARRW